MNLLEVSGLVAGYGDVQILNGVSLNLERGRLTTLVGSNGAGKTTLLRSIMGLVRPSQGSIQFAGQAVTRLPPHKRASEGLVLVPEGRQLFVEMSVLENLEMGSFSARARPYRRQNLERVFALFPRLAARQRQQAGTLSGGEQQMLAIGRGLMAQPAILMLDELSLGLAPALALQLFEKLRQLKADGLTMLLVEQGVQLALALSDYAYVLKEGRIWIEGPANAVAQRPEVRQAYLSHG